MAVGMRVTARCDQAVRAATELAGHRRHGGRRGPGRRRPLAEGARSETPVRTSGILAEVWNALRASELAVLEAVTLADLAAGRLPDSVRALVLTAEFTSPR